MSSCIDDDTTVAAALEETLLEVIDVSSCASAHDQLVKSAKFHQHGLYVVIINIIISSSVIIIGNPCKIV